MTTRPATKEITMTTARLCYRTQKYRQGRNMSPGTCGKPEFKNGLCKAHYEASQEAGRRAVAKAAWCDANPDADPRAWPGPNAA